MFIVFGTRGVKSTKDQGRFICPQCQAERAYTHYNVRRFFTLFFIPVIPLDSLGEYVKCGSCRSEFYPQVWDITAQVNAEVEEQFAYVVRDVLVATLQQTGASELQGQRLRTILSQTFNWPYEESELAADLEKVRGENLKFTSYLVGHTLKNSQIGRLCLCVAQLLATDTQYALKDQPVLLELRQYFNLSDNQFEAVVAEAQK